jgi:hypothetical protein
VTGMRPTEGPPNLLGCRAKLGRARSHFEALASRVGNFFARQRYIVSVERHDDGKQYIARLVKPPEIPAIEWALLIGDCIHNARSAPDYLVWELAGADPDDRTTMFPIFLTPEGYRAGWPPSSHRCPHRP